MLKVWQLAARYPNESINCARISKDLVRDKCQKALAQGGILAGRLLIRNLCSDTNMAKALVIVADGTEEMEAVSTKCKDLAVNK